MYGILEKDHPQTVRGTFYQATVQGVIEKTELGYRTIKRCLAEMRKNGELPFSWISDSTRWMRKPDTYSGVDQLLLEAGRYYRKAIWDDQFDYVEVWMEKDALAGIVYPVMLTRLLNCGLVI